MKICFATHNENKLLEVKTLLHPIEVIGLNEIGLTEEIPETGSTLDQNAIIKANYIHSKYGLDCFADDTGLEVESLNGAPGVYSARYAGEPRNNEANIELLLENLKDFSNRKARFRTSICLIIDSTRIMFDGVVNGAIINSKVGVKGFGYDPIFLPDGYDKTFAEMSMEEKNLISHRGRAIKKLTQYLHALE